LTQGYWYDVDVASTPLGPGRTWYGPYGRCALFCFFDHQVLIHQWGWTVVLNPDGTTTAWNNDKTKILHSHGPPARPE